MSSLTCAECGRRYPGHSVLCKTGLAASTPPMSKENAELTALRKDKARLDWLESKVRPFTDWTTPTEQPGRELFCRWIGNGHLRAAIDAAMEGK